MLQRDYLMRRIEEMMQLIALALKYRHEGKISDSMKAIAQAYNEIPNIEREAMAKMTPQELEEFLLGSETSDPVFIDILASLLYEEGEVMLSQNKEEQTKDYFEKALRLFHYVNQNSGVFSFDRLSKISRIKDWLKQ